MSITAYFSTPLHWNDENHPELGMLQARVRELQHLRRILRKYVDYYHSCRTHLSLEKDAPEPRRVESPTMGKVRAIPKVGGLHHYYTRRAALHSTCCLSPICSGWLRDFAPAYTSTQSRADAGSQNVLHEDDQSVLVAGSLPISCSSSLWKGQVGVSGQILHVLQGHVLAEYIRDLHHADE